MLATLDQSLAKLRLDYVDLYLVHWPAPMPDRYLATRRAFERLYADHRVRAIGVSDLGPDHLRRLFDNSDVVPAVNKIEFHPYLQQHDLFDLHKELGLAAEAWSPRGQGGPLLKDAVIGAITTRQERSAAQVILRWNVQRGNIVVPRSATEARIRENIALFDFELRDEDNGSHQGVHRGVRYGQYPNDFIDDF